MLAKTAPKARYTYGLRGSSILAALANALLLLLACGAIAWEAVQRFAAPAAVEGVTVSVVAAIGVVVNGFSAWLFMAGSKGDINIRGAYLHMAADAAISLGVVVSGLAIMGTGWTWLDPAVSLAIVLVIVIGTWSLLRESAGLILAAVPDSVDAAGIQGYLEGRPGVAEVHDLHIWAISTTETALTAHLVMPGGHGRRGAGTRSGRNRDRFGIHHARCRSKRAATPASSHRPNWSRL